MPVCPDCSVWWQEFSDGHYDQDATWYCKMCWNRYDNEEKAERQKSGLLLAEDRVIWYSPGSVYPVQTHRSSPSHEAWSDLGDLIIELEENQGSLSWKILPNDDFIFAGGTSALIIGSNVQLTSLSQLPFIHGIHKIKDDRINQLKRLSKVARQERRLLRNLETKQKLKQQAEIDLKKRELLEIAMKRAEKKSVKKPGKLAQIRKKIEIWKNERIEFLRDLKINPPIKRQKILDF